MVNGCGSFCEYFSVKLFSWVDLKCILALWQRIDFQLNDGAGESLCSGNFLFYQLHKSKQAAKTVDNKFFFKFKSCHTLPQGIHACVVYPTFPTKVLHFILLEIPIITHSRSALGHMQSLWLEDYCTDSGTRHHFPAGRLWVIWPCASVSLPVEWGQPKHLCLRIVLRSKYM